MKAIGKVEIEGWKYTTYEIENEDKEKYVGFIYVTVDNISGKMYVGQHSLWKKDYLGSSKEILKAIEENGKKNFTRHIINFGITPENLNIKELFYQKKWKVDENSNFINKRITAFGGGLVTDEIKQKMSLAHKGVLHSKEQIRKISESNSKQVDVYRGGVFLFSFRSQIEANKFCDEENLPKLNDNLAINRYSSSKNGYFFKYSDCPIVPEDGDFEWSNEYFFEVEFLKLIREELENCLKGLNTSITNLEEANMAKHQQVELVS